MEIELKAIMQERFITGTITPAVNTRTILIPCDVDPRYVLVLADGMESMTEQDAMTGGFFADLDAYRLNDSAGVPVLGLAIYKTSAYTDGWTSASSSYCEYDSEDEEITIQTVSTANFKSGKKYKYWIVPRGDF